MTYATSNPTALPLSIPPLQPASPVGHYSLYMILNYTCESNYSSKHSQPTPAQPRTRAPLIRCLRDEGERHDRTRLFYSDTEIPALGRSGGAYRERIRGGDKAYHQYTAYIFLPFGDSGRER